MELVMKTEVEIGWDGSLPEREERGLFPETFAARRAAQRRERASFREDGEYVTYDQALVVELKQQKTDNQTER